MLSILLTLLVLTTAPQEITPSPDSLLVMFWNIENMFDTDSGNGGQEFSGHGLRRWTRRRFFAKCEAIGKTILACADRYGRIPDMVAFAELENAYVLRKIASSDAIHKIAYSSVHFDSPDSRGIDVGLLYRKDLLVLKTARAVHIEGISTRDILCVDFENAPAILVNHHPSKFSGAAATDSKRASAMLTMKEVLDSLKGAGKTDVIATGDFNAPGTEENFRIMDGYMENKSLELLKNGKGTIKFDGKWDLIDMFLTTGNFRSEMKIFDFPPLLCRDSAHGGEKPFRTYSGPRYNGGVSDHLPIVLECRFN